MPETSPDAVNTNNKAFGAVRGAIRFGPDQSVSVPEAFFFIPESLKTSPESLGTSPARFEDQPNRSGNNVLGFGNSHASFGSSHASFGNSPEPFGTSLHAFGSEPERLGCANARAKIERKPGSKIDPKLIAATRELRDRVLEQINTTPLLPQGKYEVGRALSNAGAAPPAPLQLPAAA